MVYMCNSYNYINNVIFNIKINNTMYVVIKNFNFCEKNDFKIFIIFCLFAFMNIIYR